MKQQLDEDLERSADGWSTAAESWKHVEIGLWILITLAAAGLIVCVAVDAVPTWTSGLAGLVLGLGYSCAISARRRRRDANVQARRLRSLVRSN